MYKTKKKNQNDDQKQRKLFMRCGDFGLAWLGLACLALEHPCIYEVCLAGWLGSSLRSNRLGDERPPFARVLKEERGGGRPLRHTHLDTHKSAKDPARPCPHKRAFVRMARGCWRLLPEQSKQASTLAESRRAAAAAAAMGFTSGRGSRPAFARRHHPIAAPQGAGIFFCWLLPNARHPHAAVAWWLRGGGAPAWRARERARQDPPKPTSRHPQTNTHYPHHTHTTPTP